MKLKLAIWIPAMIVMTAVLNFCARFLPPETYTFRAWEALRIRKSSLGLFGPDRVYTKKRSYGDLAAIGNMPGMREYRQERFTTDACGNRNPRNIFSENPPGILMAGTSFSAGAGVEDSLTLSALLRKNYGIKVYNSAMAGIDSPEQYIALSKKLGMSSGTVLLDYVELKQVPAPGKEGSVELRISEDTDPCRTSPGPFALKTYKDILRPYVVVSPLQILVRNTLKLAKNGKILPNSDKNNVIVGELKNGETMLFTPEELRDFGVERDTSAPMALWRSYADKLERSGLELTVLLIPNKLNVYSGLLARPYLPARKGDTYLGRLEKELRRSGIGVINLEQPFKTLAAAERLTGKKVYWRDDTHWRETGIEKAAELVHEYLSPQHMPSRPDPTGKAISGHR